jgi:single-strand DNA-binding protein
MASYQKVIIAGNLGQDPEVRYLSNGDAVASFSVAVTETWKDASGERKEKTEWFRCACFKRQAEIAGEYLKKGAQVLVEGKMQTRSYESNDGQKKYVTELRVDTFKMMGARQDNENAAPRNPSNGAPRRERPSQPQGGTHGGGGSRGFDDMDDDIPFRQPYARAAWSAI